MSQILSEKYQKKGGIMTLIHTKIINDVTIDNINKYLEFHNDWLKIIRKKYNYTQFCPIPLY